jgi:hypothetical protein
MTVHGYKYQLEHVTSMSATISEPEIIGVVPEGIRATAYVTGGDLHGPKIKGRLLPVGGDWWTVRTDGVAILDVRATLSTDDGALIYTFYQGTADLGPNGYERVLEGAPPPPEGVDLRICPRYQTSHPDYLWLNRAVCIGVGKSFLEKGQVNYDIYQVC